MTADTPDSSPTEHETTEGSKLGILQPTPAAEPPTQPRNPLHGVTLEAIVTALADRYGWARLGERIPVRCFNVDPSVASSLRFLRKTPWAREKVEDLYLAMESNRKRANQRRR